MYFCNMPDYLGYMRKELFSEKVEIQTKEIVSLRFYSLHYTDLSSCLSIKKKVLKKMNGYMKLIEC